MLLQRPHGNCKIIEMHYSSSILPSSSARGSQRGQQLVRVTSERHFTHQRPNQSLSSSAVFRFQHTPQMTERCIWWTRWRQMHFKGSVDYTAKWAGKKWNKCSCVCGVNQVCKSDRDCVSLQNQKRNCISSCRWHFIGWHRNITFYRNDSTNNK